VSIDVISAPKLKGRKRRKKLSCYQLNETSCEQTETRAKTVSTLQQVTCSLASEISLISICTL